MADRDNADRGNPDRGNDDRLGGRSDAFAGRDYGGWYGPGTGRTDPTRRYTGEDRGENPAEHFPRGGDDLARRLGGADTETLRAQDHRGRGPRGYRRSDERIREEVCDRLTDDPTVDASDIEVAVQNGEVTLSGAIDSRQARRRAEDIAESVSGVTHVQNNLRPRHAGQDRNRPPIYEGATRSSALGGLDAGMGSAGVSGLSGSSAGSSAMGTAGGGNAAPGVTSTTGTGYSEMTGTGRNTDSPGPDTGKA